MRDPLMHGRPRRRQHHLHAYITIYVFDVNMFVCVWKKIEKCSVIIIKWWWGSEFNEWQQQQQQKKKRWM